MMKKFGTVQKERVLKTWGILRHKILGEKGKEL
jgi:hypothetical protein